MKKILFVLLLIPQALLAEKLERYCEMVATGRLFSRKVTIEVDFGDEKSFWKDNRIKDDNGRVVKFNNVTDALNYMGTNGWKLVNAFPISDGGTTSKVYHFYFKKEYDSADLSNGAKE